MQVSDTAKNADIKTLCSIFKETEELAYAYLTSEGTFDKFVNSALYIKYRMTVMKEEALNLSLAKSEEANKNNAK